MTKHSDLSGADLHPAKVTFAPLSQPPTFVGELRFTDSRMWIAVSIQPPEWQPVSPIPPGFNWAVEWGFIIPENRTVSRAALVFNNCTADQANSSIANFSIIHQWTGGADWLPGSPLDMTPFIQEFGIGCYTILLSGNDPYGATEQPLPGQSLALTAVNPAGAAEIFSFSSPIKGVNGLDYPGINGIYVANPFSQVALKLVNAL